MYNCFFSKKSFFSIFFALIFFNVSSQNLNKKINEIECIKKSGDDYLHKILEMHVDLNLDDYENFDDKTLRELKKLGFELEKRELKDYYSNGITSTIIIEGDKIIGISDPRLDDYSSAGSSAD